MQPHPEFRMQGGTLALICGLLVVYLVISGVVFHYLETTNEEQHKGQLRNASYKFIEKYPSVDRHELFLFALEVVEAYETGTFYENETVLSNWDIPSAIFFSTTVVTTIGYGHISPDTPGGQIYCILFAITGIPLCLVMLGGIGERLGKLKYKLSKKMMKRCCPGDTHGSAIIRGVLLTILFSAVFIVIPAAIFHFIEGWDYGTCFYYVFITLSTVGFGDYVAGLQQDPGPWRAIYRLLMCAYIFIGLAWLASIITLVQTSFQDYSDKVSHINLKKKLHWKKRNSVDVAKCSESDQQQQREKSRLPEHEDPESPEINGNFNPGYVEEKPPAKIIVDHSSKM